MFSYRTPIGQFCIARRGGSWFVEFDGGVYGPYLRADCAADAVARATIDVSHAVLTRDMVPSQVSAWVRGSRGTPVIETLRGR